MKKKTVLLPIITATLIIGATSCEKMKEDRETALLLGDWEIVDVSGDLVDADFLSDSSYDMIFEFKATGDVHFEKVDHEDYIYGVAGVWKWKNDTFTEVEMTFVGDSDVKMTLTIDLLDGDKMNGELDFSYDGYGYSGGVEMEKIYKKK